jgi:type III restriction enzyme
VKLPSWFKIETPIGTYNPYWAIVKSDETVAYLVRETKSTKNFLKLRNADSGKVRCGKAHFEALSLSFAVATNITLVLRESTCQVSALFAAETALIIEM